MKPRCRRADDELVQSVAILVLINLAALLTAAAVLRLVGSLRREIAGGRDDARLSSLDGLRGLLCVGVIIHHAAVTVAMAHAGDGWPKAESPVLELLGHSAVAFFFCITGFLFWGRVIDHGLDFAWLAFYRGRLLRIVPLYVLMAALATMLLLNEPGVGAIGGRTFATFFGEVFSFGFQNWSPIDVGTHAIRTESFDAGVHWTLRYEWVFYAALPMLAAFARGWRSIVIAALAVWGIKANGSHTALPISAMFGIGMLAAYAVRSPTLVRWMTGSAATSIVFAGVALLLICSQSRPWMFGLAPTANGMSPLAFVLTAIIFTPIAAGNSLGGLLNGAPLRLLGTVSYSVYLIHGIVLYVARPWLLPLVEPASMPNWTYWLAIAAVTLIICALSCVTYTLIEQPFILWGKRVRRGSDAHPTESLSARPLVAA